jgi:hypothetical protein
VHELCYDLVPIVVAIVLQFDLQLPMQSVPVATTVVSWCPAHGEVYLLVIGFTTTYAISACHH